MENGEDDYPGGHEFLPFPVSDDFFDVHHIYNSYTGPDYQSMKLMLARAWQEGFEAACKVLNVHPTRTIPNPYEGDTE